MSKEPDTQPHSEKLTDASPTLAGEQPLRPVDAEAVLSELASVFLNNAASSLVSQGSTGDPEGAHAHEWAPKPEDMYRVLVEQIPAVVFIAYIERGMSEAYVSPQIQSALGFSQEEWLGDPIRWYERIHADDKERWSVDAAHMFVTGEPLKSAYRVMARDGRVVWFQCEVRMVRRQDGKPWFIHGVGFDISSLKQTEQALQERTSALRKLSSTLLRMQDEERRRIARDLHDSLGQYLVALKMNLDHIRKTAASDAINALCLESNQIVQRCISETRTLSQLLHPPLLDEIGFGSAAQWYVEEFAKRSEVKVTLELPAELNGRLPKATEIVLFRVLQEALTNIHRHSASSSAEVRLRIDGSEASLQIKDHGCGISAAVLQQFEATGGGAGIGLSGMRERANEIGGKLEITSGATGTLVSVTIPFS